MKSNQTVLEQNERLEAAKKRRDSFLKLRGKSSKTKNTDKTKRSAKIFAERLVQDFENQNRSVSLKAVNQEYVVLRKIYSQLIKKFHEWRVEDEKLVGNASS